MKRTQHTKSSALEKVNPNKDQAAVTLQNLMESADDNQTAVALGYDPTDKSSAPVILASGQGELADRIKEVAEEHNIPIHQDPDLVALLAASDVGDEIPVEAFIAVAEILRFIYEKNGTKIS